MSILVSKLPVPVDEAGRQVLREQLHGVLVDQAGLVQGVLLVSTLVLYTVAAAAVPGLRPLAWLAAMLLLIALRGIHVYLVRRWPERIGLARSELLFRAGSIAFGSVVGAYSLILPLAEPAMLTFCIMVTFGTVAGSVGSISAVRGVYHCFAVPAMAPLTIRLALEPGRPHLAIAAMGVLFLILHFGLARNQFHVLAVAVATRLERDAMIDHLSAARRASEEANESKRQFLLAAGHDLRQPLFAIRLLLDQFDAREPAALAKRVSMLKASVRAISAMLDRILVAAKLESGGYTAQIEPAPLGAVLARLGDEFAQEAARRGVALKVMPCSLTVETDPVLVAQIVRNLISNALLHARSKRITVGVRRRGQHCRIEVLDQGIGIAADRTRRVFDAFYTSADDARTSTGGHGLGLALAKSMARLLGTQVELHSVLGRGSRFALTIGPVMRPDPAQRGHAASGSAGAHAPPGLVLLVEDNAAVRAAMRQLLAKWGHSVIAATTAQAALRKLGKTVPDLLLTDLRLPGGTDGLTLARELRRRCGFPVPTVILTGDVAAPVVEAPGMALVQKDLDPAILGAAIELVRAAPRSGQASSLPADGKSADHGIA